MSDKELKYNDFLEMLKTSRDVAEEIQREENPEIQLLDEDGNLYYIKNVKFEHVATGTIVIEFDHDE